MEVSESGLLGYAFRPLGEQAISLSKELGDKQADVLRRALANFLFTEAKDRGCNLIATSEEEFLGDSDFKSILYRDDGSATTTKIVSFTFRDAAMETILPLLGIAIAVYTGKWGIASTPAVADVLKRLWSKFVILRRPGDSDAIEVLEALLRVRARHVIYGSTTNPTGGEIAIDSGLARDKMTAALKSLRSRSVVEISDWGGQVDDLYDLANRWKVKL